MTISKAKVGVSYRISPENHIWLKEFSAKQERSQAWMLDKLLTEAREADEASKEKDNDNKH